MVELWEEVLQNGNYEVSNLGRFKRVMPGIGTYIGKILRTRTQKNGYVVVRLCKDGKPKDYSVHRLVARAFLGSCPFGKEVNHKDGNKQNNRVDNLEYVTRSENEKHAHRLGLKTTNYGNAKITEETVKEIRELYATGKYVRADLAKIFGVSWHIASGVVTGRNWKHIE